VSAREDDLNRVQFESHGFEGLDWRLALNSPARTRERALARYDIAHERCATQVAARTGRHPQTVLEWVHAYKAQGPAALVYRRTGGRPPFAPGSQPASMRSCAPPRVRRPPRP
jgi:transposase